MINDYNFEPNRPKRSRPLIRVRWLALSVSCVVIGVFAANSELPSSGPSEPVNTSSDAITPGQSQPWVAVPVPGATPREQAAVAIKPAISSPVQPADRIEVAVARPLPIQTPSPEPRVAVPAPSASTPAPVLPPEGGTAAAQATPAPPDPAPAEQEPATAYEHTIKSGETLSEIVERAGFPRADSVALMRIGNAPWKSLRPGQRLSFYADDAGALEQLILHRSKSSRIIIERADKGFTLRKHTIPTEIREAHAHGQIRDSLFLAGRRAGMPDGLIMDLAYIFQWDIDFALDVWRGDRFTVIYEKRYRNGEFVGVGNILAAEFVNRNRTYRAVRYKRANGQEDYFTPEGHSMRKAFLRTPLNFTRISSRFSKRRLHPVSNKFRAHKGVDYAAPRGTPVWSTGDGKVVHRGTKGGYGKTVMINHGTQYSTLYAHLKSYAKGIRNGKRVKQGQIIGYVGTTGLSTGPHLHYEFRVNGVHRDPLRVRLPHAKPLPKKEQSSFRQQTASLWERIDLVKRTELALND